MGNLAHLFEIMADARLELGRAEDWLKQCPHDERREAQRDADYALEMLRKAKEDLNCALRQLGKQPVVSERAIHKNF